MDLRDPVTQFVLGFLLASGVVTGTVSLLIGSPEPVIVWATLTAIVFASAAFFSRLARGLAMTPELRALLREAADALHTSGHDRKGHALMDPEDCRICTNNDLADRLDAAAEKG